LYGTYINRLLFILKEIKSKNLKAEKHAIKPKKQEVQKPTEKKQLDNFSNLENQILKNCLRS
jgi:hypothetical protein